MDGVMTYADIIGPVTLMDVQRANALLDMKNDLQRTSK